MIKLNEAFVFRRIYDTNLLIPFRRNVVSQDTISMNDTAACIIEKCVEASNVKELASLVCAEFLDVNNDEIYNELVSYIEQLVSEGVLVEGE